MADKQWHCPFCGSDALFFESPYVELNEDGEYVNKKDFCCVAQKQNHEYAKKRFTPDEMPDKDELAKWK